MRRAVHYAVMGGGAVHYAVMGGGAAAVHDTVMAVHYAVRLQFASMFFFYIKKIFITHLVKLFTLCTLPRNLKCILGDL